MRNTLVLLTLLVISCSSLFAQQALTDDAITKMVAAGLSESLIVQTIESQPGNYDVSVDALIALKKANVTDKVLAAMVKKTSALPDVPSPAQSLPPVAPAQAAEFVSSAPSVQSTGKIRVYMSSASKGGNLNAARDQSMEMAKDFERNCPEVRITINQNVADYTVLLNHIEHGLIRDNQFQVANKDGDLISKTKEGGSIKGGAKRACELIVADSSKK